MQQGEYLWFSIRQEKVSSAFVFGGTGAIDHELNLNFYFLRIILSLDTLHMKKQHKRENKNTHR